MDNDKLVRAFLRIRDARGALKDEYEKKDADLKAKSLMIEVSLLDFLNKNKLDSVRTKDATFYKQEEFNPACADWDALYKWIEKNDAFDILEKRIKKTFVREYMEEHKGAPPPGVTVHREYVVRVRKGNK